MGKLLLVAPLLLSLTACATTSLSSKPEFTQAQYTEFADMETLLDFCLKQEFIDSVAYAQGNSVINRALESPKYTLDRMKYNRILSDMNESNKEAIANLTASEMRDMKFVCQQTEGYAKTTYAEIQRENEIKMQSPSPVYTPYRNRSSTTYCNQFGSQVICNSY